MSTIEHQMHLEKLYNKNQLLPRMRQEFEENSGIDFKAFFAHIGIDYKFGIDAMVQMALHKRADLPTLVGTLRHHCKSAQEVADNLLRWQVRIALTLTRPSTSSLSFIQSAMTYSMNWIHFNIHYLW